MYQVGILAYGSLLEDPGKEIEPIIRERIKVRTPFCIEFARTSSTRDGAPTVVVVESGGAQVQGTIFILDESISVESAQDLLWRRETRNECSENHYKISNVPGPNTVVVERLSDFSGVKVVLYTKLAGNIIDLTAENLADLAIKSARGNAGKEGKDGISYLISLKRQEIVTPLMADYEEAILKRTHSRSLEIALAMTKGEHA
jgi:cation transport regulator ChaC